jgi:hypothetical protein
MKQKAEKAVSILLIATLLLGMILIVIPYAKANGDEYTATVRFIPSLVTVTGNSQLFTVACVVEDAYKLSGVNIQIKWNTTYLSYISHEPTVPVEDYPSPIAPSPYAGIIHAPETQLKDEVDGSLGLGTYWFHFATSDGPSFYGDGTAFTIAFMSQNIPYGDPSNFFDTYIEILNCDLTRSRCGCLDCVWENGIVRIYEQEFSYPPWPKLSITPDETEFDDVFENETVDVVLHGYDVDTQTITDLPAFWDVAGIDMYINFDPTLFQCVDVVVDPDGWFASFWASDIFIVADDIDNIAGTVHVAFSGYGEIHTPLYGAGRVAELVMQATVDFTTTPPCSPITLANPFVNGPPWICDDDPTDPFFGVTPIVEVAGFPHEERGYCPWHNKNYSVPLPHVVNDGCLTPPFRPRGGFIDLYVCYPDPYGGQGWGKNASMIWPQKEFCFKANVSYSGWPEQYKDVALQLFDPTGTPWGIWVNRTDTRGFVQICVRMPWPCPTNDTMPWDYFGVWKVIATVDVACIVYNDTLYFKYDYLVNIWDAEADKPSYRHCEDITVTITYGTYAMRYYNITFAITACDDSGVPFGLAYETVTIGKGAYGWCWYVNGTLQLTVHIEKFAQPPFATIYVVALNGPPSEGGSAETPVFEIIVEIEPH